MIPVFIGWDSRESVAWHVLGASIFQQCSLPVGLFPVGNKVLPKDIWWRERASTDSTEFSNARFLVPYLMKYKGWAIFMDCDMVCLGDLAELWSQRNDDYAVMLRKHVHIPRNPTKFLDTPQIAYRRKNWSSLMLLNCAHPACQELTLEYVNNAPGLDLHGFAWCPGESLIGEISGPWNELVRQDGGPRAATDAKLAHFTEGGPWHGHIRQQYVEDWMDWMASLLSGGNPVADVDYRLRSTVVGDNAEIEVVYSKR